MNKIRMNLEGVNGNAFHLLGEFGRMAEQQGWSASAVDSVRDEAMAGDYSHLLRTLGRYTEPLVKEN